MKNAFRFRIPDGVPKYVRAYYLFFASWLEKNLEMHTHVTVVLRNRRAVFTHPFEAGGYFNPESAETRSAVGHTGPVIELACRYKDLHDPIMPFLLLTVFAHEMVHYEQMQSGRPYNHRGVKQRALSLVRKFYRERKPPKHNRWMKHFTKAGD